MNFHLVFLDLFVVIVLVRMVHVFLQELLVYILLLSLSAELAL